MKYQYRLNGQIIFETDNISEYFKYLYENPTLRDAVLYNLLDKSNEYIANMATQ